MGSYSLKSLHRLPTLALLAALSVAWPAFSLPIVLVGWCIPAYSSTLNYYLFRDFGESWLLYCANESNKVQLILFLQEKSLMDFW